MTNSAMSAAATSINSAERVIVNCASIMRM